MILTPRLKIIADSLNGFDTVADIGSDHAYLPIHLVKSGHVRSVIATDVNKGPVRIAKGRVESHGAGAAINVRLGNGLKAIREGEAEAVVIAGMGGLLIRDILENDIEIARSSKLLVLQPMKDSDKLRKWLFENSFDITDEELVKDQDKIYEVIWAKPAAMPKEIKGLLLVGDRIIEKKHPLLPELISKKTRELEKIMDTLEIMDTGNCRERSAECRAMLDFYREVAEWVR